MGAVRRLGPHTRVTAALLSSLALAACGGGASPAVAPIATPSASNTPPTISGSPPTSTVAGLPYSFTPTATDSDGDPLTFSIQNLPSWASFSNGTGALTGTPPAAAVYSNIIISVSDGKTSTTLPAFGVTVATPPASGTTLSSQYPGDIGFDADPSVVLHEAFQEGSISAFVARYETYTNTAGMSLVADHPANSSGTYSLQMIAGGSTPATDFFKSFGTGYDELWFRYYIKYLGAGPWHHSGLWIGGYNPSLTYPYPHAGVKPNGDDRFSIGLEPQASTVNAEMDFYAYWMQMHSWKAAPTGAVGDYYGNSMIHSNAFRVPSDEWVCLEIHLKLNPDLTSGAGAILEVWQNDLLVRRFDETGPYGWWVGDAFCPDGADDTQCTAYPAPAGAPPTLLNQQWRSTAPLKINNFWPQNYNTDSANSTLLLDDMVVAGRRIGCTVKI
jgi:hypothetical protein